MRKCQEPNLGLFRGWSVPECPRSNLRCFEARRTKIYFKAYLTGFVFEIFRFLYLHRAMLQLDLLLQFAKKVAVRRLHAQARYAGAHEAARCCLAWCRRLRLSLDTTVWLRTRLEQIWHSWVIRCSSKQLVRHLTSFLNRFHLPPFWKQLYIPLII